ncbi:WD domain-containing protein [Cladophialophora immunda]|nr:WD domain-containing protein [Cladophialophora immunda]
MDIDRDPPSKRRRTSSEDSFSSRNSAAEPRSHLPALRHPDSRDARRGRGYSSSRSRNASRDDTPNIRRSRSRSRSRSRRSLSRSRTPSSVYESGREHQPRSRSESRRRPRSRSRSRSRSFDSSLDRRGSRSRSRLPSASPIPGPTEKPKSLNFTPLITLARAHARGITSIKFSPDMTLLATASADNAINIYSVPSNPTPDTPLKHIRTLRAHLAGVNAIAWSPVGPPYTLVSAGDDKSILLWSPLSSDFPIAPSPFMGHSNYVYSLAFSPKGNMLVSGSFDEAVFLWDVRSGRVMRSLPAHSDPVGGVDFLKDGTMVCSCAGDGLIRIWDAGTGQCLKTLVDEDRKAVTSVRFSPNGKFVLAWTLDNCVRLWNYIEGRCVKTYQGHVNQEYSLSGTVGSYSHKSGTGQRRLEAFLASGSEDGDVLAWDVTSKEVLWRGKGHRDVVLAMDFGRTQEGKGLLVSGGKDRDLRIWMLEGDEADADFFAATTAADRQDLDRGRDDVDMDMDMQMTMDMGDVVDGPTSRGNHDMHGDAGGGGGGAAAVDDGNDMDIDGENPA